MSGGADTVGQREAARGIPRPKRRIGLDLARPSRRHWLGYLLLLPAVLLIALIIVYPLFVSLDLSFQNVGIPRLGQARRPFTTDNYQRLFASEDFWLACWVTFKLVVVVPTFCFLLGLATALLVNNRFKGRSIARLLVALPWAVPEVIAVVIFAWIFDSSFGLMNWLFVKLGISATDDQLVLGSPGGFCARLRRHGVEGLSLRFDHDAGRPAVDPRRLLPCRTRRRRKRLAAAMEHHHAEPHAGARRDPGTGHALGLPRLLDHLRR